MVTAMFVRVVVTVHTTTEAAVVQVAPMVRTTTEAADVRVVPTVHITMAVAAVQAVPMVHITTGVEDAQGHLVARAVPPTVRIQEIIQGEVVLGQIAPTNVRPIALKIVPVIALENAVINVLITVVGYVIIPAIQTVEQAVTEVVEVDAHHYVRDRVVARAQKVLRVVEVAMVAVGASAHAHVLVTVIPLVNFLENFEKDE